MRTIRIEMEAETDDGGTLRLATEVIVDDGDEAEAGASAKRAMDSFIQGYSNG